VIYYELLKSITHYLDYKTIVPGKCPFIYGALFSMLVGFIH